MDDVDIANERAADDLARAISAARGEIKPGIPGDCYRCGEYSPRLIGDACATCRDRYRLP